MSQVPQQPRPDEPCDERIDKLAHEVGYEIKKAWTDQESDGDALARIDELMATAAGRQDPDGTLVAPEEAEELRRQVRTWHPPSKG